jgi:hypothetical protein
MLGEHNLAAEFQVNADRRGFDRNLVALIGYENRKHRWKRGVVGEMMTLLAAGSDPRIEGLPPVDTASLLDAGM